MARAGGGQSRLRREGRREGRRSSAGCGAGAGSRRDEAGTPAAGAAADPSSGRARTRGRPDDSRRRRHRHRHRRVRGRARRPRRGGRPPRTRAGRRDEGPHRSSCVVEGSCRAVCVVSWPPTTLSSPRARPRRPPPNRSDRSFASAAWTAARGGTDGTQSSSATRGFNRSRRTPSVDPRLKSTSGPSRTRKRRRSAREGGIRRRKGDGRDRRRRRRRGRGDNG